MDKQQIDDAMNSDYFKRLLVNFDTPTMSPDARLPNDNSCDKHTSKTMDKSFTQLAGYDAMEGNTFYLEPEKKNTFHNYPVLQDDGLYCSMNHQIFRNNTRRKLSHTSEESDVLHKNL
jgi:hypothetical protein